MAPPRGGRGILLKYKAQHCFLFDIEGMTVLKGTTMFQKAAQHLATKPQNLGFKGHDHLYVDNAESYCRALEEGP